MTILTASCALLISGLTLRVTRDGQMTGRFASAVDQLGNPNSGTKVGAIYALSRLARDSADDRPFVTGLLTDYVRSQIGVTVPEDCSSAPRPPMDVVVALRVLFYDIKGESRAGEVDLGGLCITNVRFPRADLRCMRLDNVIISGSDFSGAHFSDASLKNANLRSSAFGGADFTRADAEGARFGDESPTPSADLTGAILREADLTDAMLVDVDLSGADFSRAVLKDTDLHKSILHGTKLKTYLDDVNRLPDDVDRSGSLAARPSPSARRCGG